MARIWARFRLNPAATATAHGAHLRLGAPVAREFQKEAAWRSQATAPGLKLSSMCSIVVVGGFLGMGEKDVALTFDQLSFATDSNDPLVVKTNATKESLQAAPQHTKPDKR